MHNQFRLMSSVYEREDDSERVFVEKRIFLSVEGNTTEKEYFDDVSDNRVGLGINAKVDVEVLGRGRKDTNSAPQQVVELLEEYIRLREQNEDDFLEETSNQFKETYSVDFIKQYLENPENVPRKQRNAFVTELRKIGFDINYRKYLKKYNRELDEFAVLIDRDKDTHSQINMSECINHCKENGYKCYIANPCFEFWLLLHLADIEKEFGNRLDEIKENKKVSKQHTFVSKEVSGRAHHGKSNIGCNLWKLMEQLKKYPAAPTSCETP